MNEVKRVLEESLKDRLSHGKKRNIIFWYDENKEFEEDIDELNLPEVKVLKLDGNNSFYAKYQLEKVDTESNYLVYAPFGKPCPRDNYLLDILKYNIEFTTDKAAVLMREMNLIDESNLGIFKKYLKFFNNKDRLKLFKSYNLQDLSGEKIHIAVISALCHLQYPDFDRSLKVILSEGMGDNKYMDQIDKFGDPDTFWDIVENHYGCSFEKRSLQGLMTMFIITYLSDSLFEKMPDTWAKYESKEKTDCIVFLSNFMNNRQYAKSYNLLSKTIEEKLKAEDYIQNWDIEKYTNCDAFRYFDTAIINKIKEQLLLDIGEFPKYKDIILKRRTKHWYNSFKYEYNCVLFAVQLLEEWKRAEGSIKAYSPYEFFMKYTEELYMMDTYYRKFYLFFDGLDSKEDMALLKEKVENTYVNGYLNALSVKWTASLEELGGNWKVTGLTSQDSFYRTYIKNHVDKGERVFVIISDALRYECAKEICDILNNEKKGSLEISSMLGTIPSNTKFGMASLLPNKEIIVDKGFDVLVDGMNSEGTENRGKVLLNYCKKSVAILYDTIVDMKREDFREAFAGKDLIYIYHNNIDARGDHAATEREVFESIEETFEELKSLLNSLINNVTAINIYIVADHGFIYKRGNLSEFHKTPKERSEDSIENRRFILTRGKRNIEGTLKFNMDYLFQGVSELEYITPKGANRFKVQGKGANYVHGGTSLQEIVVPVIRFKNDRSKSGRNDVKKVDLRLTNISRKITNSITSFEFFQTEKVEEKRLPRKVRIYFADEDGNKISNENLVIADSKSLNPEDRALKQNFVLKNMKYDKNKKYYLVLEDEEGTAEVAYDKVPFVIDITFI